MGAKMAEQVTSRAPVHIQAECYQVFRDSKERGADFAALKERINSLSQEVLSMDGYPQASTFLVQATINCNRRRDPSSDSLKSQFIHWGEKNQFDLSASQTSSACTNIIQYFLTQVLYLRHPGSIDRAFVDECVEEGTKNHDYCLHANRMAHKKGGVQLKENFGHSETSGLYPLEDIAIPQTVYEVTEDMDKTTRSCLIYVLIKLEQLFIEQQGPPIGVVITAHGETYGLALFRHQSEIIYVLMNSHGDVIWEGERTKAYILATNEQDEMVNKLAELIPYLKNTVEDVSEEVKAWLEAEIDREFSLSPVKLNMLPPDIDLTVRGRGVAETAGPEQREEGSAQSGAVENPSGSVNGSLPPANAPSKDETEKVNYLAVGLLLSAAVVFTFRNWLVSMITSYTRMDGQTYIPPTTPTK